MNNDKHESRTFEDTIDALFCGVRSRFHISSFREFCERERERERVERANEFHAYDIVIEILSSDVDSERLSLRFARKHSSVILDNKVSKSICRFYLSYMKNKSKYITIRNISGEHEKIFINDIEDIYLYEEKLKNALRMLQLTSGSLKEE